MLMKNKSIRVWVFISIIFLVNAGANFLVVVLGQFVIARYSLYQRELAAFIQNTVFADPDKLFIFLVIYIMSFIVPVVIITIYTIPIYRYLKNSHLSYKKRLLAKSRIINLPLYHSLFGALGWIVGFAGYLNNYYMNQYPAGSIEIMVNLIMQLSFAAFCFVLTYYSLEFIMRKYYLPRIFTENKLSDIKNSRKVSIRMRFFILFFAISVFPLMVVIAVAFGQIHYTEFSEEAIALISIAGGLMITSYLISWLVAESYRKPIENMTIAAKKIRKADYDIRIQVRSNDEIGILSETLNETASELKDKEYIKETFGKVVDPGVRDYLLKSNLKMGGELKTVTILFSDIRSFTSMSERLTPELLVSVLNRYFEKISAAITKNNGMVNKYIGDAVLGVFGAPLPLEGHADYAVKAGVDMITAREELNKELISEGMEPIRSGVGIHTGEVIAGNVGSSSRMEYTVIGDAVNTASRLESETKSHEAQIIFSRSTLDSLKNEYKVRSLGSLMLRGKKEEFQAFTIS